MTPSPSHSLGSGAHPERWVLLAPAHSTPPPRSQPLRCREWSRGRLLGRFPGPAGQPLLFQKEEGRPCIWGQSLHPHPPWPEASVHPVTWPLGDGPAVGWSQSPRTTPPPSVGRCPLCFRGQSPLAHLPRPGIRVCAVPLLQGPAVALCPRAGIASLSQPQGAGCPEDKSPWPQPPPTPCHPCWGCRKGPTCDCSRL